MLDDFDAFPNLKTIAFSLEAELPKKINPPAFVKSIYVEGRARKDSDITADHLEEFDGPYLERVVFESSAETSPLRTVNTTMPVFEGSFSSAMVVDMSMGRDVFAFEEVSIENPHLRYLCINGGRG